LRTIKVVWDPTISELRDTADKQQQSRQHAALCCLHGHFACSIPSCHSCRKADLWHVTL
jgi:hypothetical protein